MATVVALVALVGLISAITMGSEMLDVSHKQTVAMQILHNEVEQVHMRDWSSFSTTLPTSYIIRINSDGTGLAAGATADKRAFALTNYTSSIADDNKHLMSVARDFTCTLTISSVRSNLLLLTYTVSWTSGNRRKTYTRTSSTYYGKNGLNTYYQR